VCACNVPRHALHLASSLHLCPLARDEFSEGARRQILLALLHLIRSFDLHTDEGMRARKGGLREVIKKGGQ
jgi:hypothetical protein